MTAPDAVDSFGAPDPKALAAAGVKLACRYLSPPPNSKNVTAAEIAALHAAGVGVLFNWESQPDRSLGGAANGTADGLGALQLAVSLGVPPGTAIYFSSDFQSNPGQYPTIRAYYQAAGAALGPYQCGAYGDGLLIDELTDFDLIAGAWQTYAWSAGYVSPNADLYQYLNEQPFAGTTVDFDRIINPNLGAWWPPSDPPIFGDDDMEMIRNSDNGAVIAHLGGGVLQAVPPSTYGTWTAMGRPVSEMPTNRWTDYVNFLAAANAAEEAAVAALVEKSISIAEPLTDAQVQADVSEAVAGLTVTSTAVLSGTATPQGSTS